MKLTGKCKEDFEDWYLKKHANRTDIPIEIGVFATLELNYFYIAVHSSMQIGVYVDFFEDNCKDGTVRIAITNRLRIMGDSYTVAEVMRFTIKDLDTSYNKTSTKTN